MPSSADNLIHRAVAGDTDALSALLERHGPYVRRRVAGQIPPRWRSVLSAEDVVQETYIDAFLDIGGFTPGVDGDSFVGWLITLAKRNLVDAIRMLEAEKRGGRRKRVKSRGTRASLADLYEQIGHSRSTPSQQLARKEAEVLLRRAVEQLPPAYRAVIEAYDLEEQPVDDVAAQLKRSAGAVFMLRSRAHRILHKYMGTASLYLSDGG